MKCEFCGSKIKKGDNVVKVVVGKMFRRKRTIAHLDCFLDNRAKERAAKEDHI